MNVVENLNLPYEELKIIGHSLGINVYHAKQSKLKRDKKLPKEFYRNYFCAGDEKTTDYPVLKSLEENGLVERFTHIGQLYFGITDAGISLFRSEFAKYIEIPAPVQKVDKSNDKDLPF